MYLYLHKCYAKQVAESSPLEILELKKGGIRSNSRQKGASGPEGGKPSNWKSKQTSCSWGHAPSIGLQSAANSLPTLSSLFINFLAFGTFCHYPYAAESSPASAPRHSCFAYVQSQSQSQAETKAETEMKHKSWAQYAPTPGSHNS